MLLEENERPGWTVSGAWAADDELILVDTLYNRLLRYSSSRRYLGLETKAFLEFSEPFQERGLFFPSGLEKVPSGVWMELWDAEAGRLRFARLTPNLSLHSLIDVINLRTRDGRKIDSVFSWSAADDDLVVYSGLPEGNRSSGFFRIQLDVDREAVTRVDLLKEVSRESQPWVWYRLGYHYISNLGQTAILLGINDKSLTILTHDPKEKELTPIELEPQGLLSQTLNSPPPHLPEFFAPADFVGVMKVVESSTMPVGLYGWEDRLYVVWRRPKGDGTEWLLTKINPYSQQELGTAILPSTANHLTVVPGPKHWALVEKGPVQGFGQQVVSAIRFIPSGSIRGDLSLTRICQ